MRRIDVTTWALVIGMAGHLGCSKQEGHERAAVGGEIKVDGQPLVNGSINFYPVEGNDGPSAGGVIKEGRYDLPTDQGPLVGKNRVEIRGVKKTGRQVPNHMAPGTMRDELVEALGKEANEKSTLVREVASGTNNFDFELKGAPDRPLAKGGPIGTR